MATSSALPNRASGIRLTMPAAMLRAWSAGRPNLSRSGVSIGSGPTTLTLMRRSDASDAFVAQRRLVARSNTAFRARLFAGAENFCTQMPQGEAVAELDMGQAEQFGGGAGLGEHLIGHVDTDDDAGASDVVGGDEAVEPGA
jgi:hypothetical protein